MKLSDVLSILIKAWMAIILVAGLLVIFTILSMYRFW